MGIIWNENGSLNSTRDTFNHYNGQIAIEIRGSSSQTFPKKSYGFETRDENNKDLDFPLLGLPQEEDWIFYGPYSDKSLIRNALVFTLAKSLGQYSSRIRFVELFLNDNYQGIFLLMEKIKRDSTRVDIAKLNPDETSGSDKTGGYIIKIDKETGSGGSGWYSQYKNLNGTKTFYQFEVPAQDEIADEQKQYIQTYVKAFEDAVYTRKFDGAGNYKDYIEVTSFIDYILLSELTRNIDSYRLSTFLNKDKNGKLRAGPVWDYNLAFGNANYYNGWLTSGFQFDARMDKHDFDNPFWWKVMLTDTAFVNDMHCRWQILREESWSQERIFSLTDSLVSTLDDAVERNFQRWPVMGYYVWPNYFVASSYRDEIYWMKNWIRNRLSWLDSNLPGRCGEGLPPASGELQVLIYPNPVSSKINLQINSGTTLIERFQLYNLNGMLVRDRQLIILEGEQTIKIDVADLPKGIYLYNLYSKNGLHQKGKLMKL